VDGRAAVPKEAGARAADVRVLKEMVADAAQGLPAIGAGRTPDPSSP